MKISTDGSERGICIWSCVCGVSLKYLQKFTQNENVYLIGGGLKVGMLLLLLIAEVK